MFDIPNHRLGAFCRTFALMQYLQMRFFFFSLLMLCLIAPASAQAPKRKVIQFSGVVVSGDSLQPVPYTNISDKSTHHGTMSDYYGFFSFVAQENDTVEFSSIGYRKAQYVIPSNLTESRYSIIQVLNRDTIELATTVIYAWPTREQIYEYFLTAPVPDDDVERARKNLAQEKITDMAINMPMDASMNYRNTMSNYNTRLYTAGQIPMNNLLNPIAWAKFVEAWKKGDFKKKASN
ncbi:MAG: hypothetical protein RLZZ543_1774 [Bacteroidota bacterium]